MTLHSQLESVLFVAGKPLSPAELARALCTDVAAIGVALEELKLKFNALESGIHIIDTGSSVQMTTNPANSQAVDKFTTEEIKGELTRAQLESLTVIAYQGPITRPELEAIRGVNCAIILRNLELRGLVEATDDADKLLPVYSLTVEALRHLGLASPSDLPGYSELHDHPHVAAVGQPQED
ncbi:MAG: Segregation and condensation protein B [Candidatus Magasanikbacteria bacterium GW2011_GWA2_56_11]|uniref:Segregation and condensation protein B n=1 Tax=Candidatus Magasanikbacteria bacterium GW2011_GWA2_56_11 TaxID=1619044 RepID=A0A0G1YFV7_9BACT|nr:MAG: Segregation and condensation protein B [Candidatus Magasanikbacteria bacterium GW2011_GWA2_56_11]